MTKYNLLLLRAVKGEQCAACFKFPRPNCKADTLTSTEDLSKMCHHLNCQPGKVLSGITGTAPGSPTRPARCQPFLAHLSFPSSLPRKHAEHSLHSAPPRTRVLAVALRQSGWLSHVRGSRPAETLSPRPLRVPCTASRNGRQLWSRPSRRPTRAASARAAQRSGRRGGAGEKRGSGGGRRLRSGAVAAANCRWRGRRHGGLPPSANRRRCRDRAAASGCGRSGAGKPG